MAFDFLGTFNQSQFSRFQTFAQAQLPILDGRIQHLQAEIGRLGTLQMTYDMAGKPLGYAPPSKETYLGRLFGVYEVLGGDPFHDLQVRPMSAPVFQVSGDESAPARMLSNGEPIPELGLADAPSANLMRQLKTPFADTLVRRENLERKIRRVLDYADQLASEVKQLGVLRSAVSTPGSLANLISEVQDLFKDKTYRAIIDDKGKDPFGKYVRARYGSYEPNADHPPDGVGVERTESGYFTYGEDPESGGGSG